MGPVVMTQLANGLSVLVKPVMDQNTMMGGGPFQRCSTCNSNGQVSCLCSRWSDGDAGCKTYSGSGRMSWSSCGGSGTGRQIPVWVSMKDPNIPRS